MTDLATGLYAHGAIMASLLQRQKTGQGQKINCDLLSTQVLKKHFVNKHDYNISNTLLTSYSIIEMIKHHFLL